MKQPRSRRIRDLLKWPAFLGGMLLIAGCESDSARSPVTIDPDHIQMRRGQEQAFVVSGGYDYQWSLENKELGTLSRTPEAHRVIYTARQAPETGTAVQVLRVVSWVEGASQSGSSQTNQQSASAYQVSAEAYIVHLADKATPSATEAALSISPVSVTLGANDSARTFVVSGGRPGYRWSLTDNSLGTLNASGSSAIYTRGPNAGSLFIRVIDAAGKQVEASIIQSVASSANGGNNDIPTP